MNNDFLTERVYKTPTKDKNQEYKTKQKEKNTTETKSQIAQIIIETNKFLGKEEKSLCKWSIIGMLMFCNTFRMPFVLFQCDCSNLGKQFQTWL